MKANFLFLFALVLFACNNSNDNPITAESMDTDGYQLQTVTNTDVQRAVKTDASGNVIERGYISNNQRTGTWTVYHPNGYVKSITSYINGQLDGPYMEYTDRGQLVAMTTYSNNQFDGPAVKYKFNRIIEASNYQNGKLEGVYRKYHERNNKLQSEATYKNGVLDGTYRYYNEEGDVTLEYQYENGEKVSGGTVTGNTENEEEEKE